MITLLISEEMKIVGTSFSGRLKENVFYSNTSKGRARSGRTLFQGQHQSSHGGYHQHDGQLHGGGRGNFRGRGSH